jgi:hypothetical protein
VDAPLSNLQITDPSLPTDQELAAVGYSPSVLNAYSINLEDALLQQNQMMEEVGGRLQATEKVMTDPHILANYVVDFNQKVDNNFLNRVADYYDQELAQSQQQQQQAYQQQYGQPVQAQMQGQPQMQQPQGMQMPTPGVGMGMVTPEMLRTSEVVVPPQRYNQPLNMQQTGPSQLQQPYVGNAPVGPAPAMPAPAGQVSQDDIWASVRQAMAMNPSTAWQTYSQIEAMYGPQALAKPLIRA